jgi:hypothetical protein
MLSWFPAKQQTDELPPTLIRQRLTAAVIVALARQDDDEMSPMRQRWTEAEVRALPAGEHDYFDRKSGAIFGDTEKLKGTLAKGVSALANSGGGSLILGVQDDGTLDGVPLLRGATPVREWLEQVIPGLVSYPIAAFRVHIVEADAEASEIPAGVGIVVVDVGDSALAPHQCAFSGGQAIKGIYYQRQGGHSVPAPHFYIELLRQRLTSPVLRYEPEVLRLKRTGAPPAGGLFIEMTLQGTIHNDGRVAAYKWGVQGRWEYESELAGRFFGNESEFPIRGGPSSIDVGDRTILPGGERGHTLSFGLSLPAEADAALRRNQLETYLRSVQLQYRVATESGLSDYAGIALSAVPNFREFIDGCFSY